MALNPKYIVSINLQEYLVDKDTGLPLSDGYIQFFQDSSRTTPKLVYQLTGSPPNYTYSALSNPVNLSAVGVPVDADGNQVHIYYYPYDDNNLIQLYYVVVYNSDGVLQYTLEGWPNITAEDNPADQNNTVSNQISNCQFSQVNFVVDQGLLIEFDSALEAAEYQIAPDWIIVITSSAAGSLAIQQVALEGALNIQTNPPYKLTFTPSGVTITRLVLRQIFNHNPDIWSATTEGGGYISGIMLVESLDGQAYEIEMQYVQSGGPSAPQTIVTGSTLTSGYQLLNDTVLLNAGTNTDNADEGAIYIDILLPNTGFYSLTSIQVCGLNDDNSIVNFEQESVNRQIDHLFHYYKSPLDFKPIKSYLCGWDFPLNPAQPLGSSVAVGAVNSAYVWDQTIIWQSIVSSISVTRATTGNIKGSLNIAVANTCQFSVIQYLTVPQIIDLLSNPLSSNIVLSSNQASLAGTISLWYTTDSNLPSLNTYHESFIASVNSSGIPVSFNGIWTQIERNNYGNATFTKSSLSDLNILESFGFSGWNFDYNTVDLSTITYFAISIGFESVNAGNNVVIQSCSLIPGNISTIPAPQTFNEVLEDCQYYYEKSYETQTVPGTHTYINSLSFMMGSYFSGGTFTSYPTNFQIIYKKIKISNPIISTYNPEETSSGGGEWSVGYLNTFPSPDAGVNPKNFGVNNWFTIQSSGLDNVVYIPSISAGPIMQFSGGGTTYSYVSYVRFQYTADARLGIY